jgi:hypothetical protein
VLRRQVKSLPRSCTPSACADWWAPSPGAAAGSCAARCCRLSRSHAWHLSLQQSEGYLRIACTVRTEGEQQTNKECGWKGGGGGRPRSHEEQVRGRSVVSGGTGPRQQGGSMHKGSPAKQGGSQAAQPRSRGGGRPGRHEGRGRPWGRRGTAGHRTVPLSTRRSRRPW